MTQIQNERIGKIVWNFGHWNLFGIWLLGILEAVTDKMNEIRMTDQQSTVSLFIPCLVDQVYPEMGLAMARVLKKLGFSVHYDSRQTCCGQPAFNAGYRDEARQVASHFLDVFHEAGTVVSPSGSCTGMVRNYFPVLFPADPEAARARALGRSVFEFSEFLQNTGAIERIDGHFDGRVGFHNSCHSLRELGVQEQPFAVLQRISGIEWAQPQEEPVCCGFGGLFSFKFPSIAEGMAKTRLEMFVDAGAETLVSNDPRCIMHMRQEAEAKNMPTRILHLAEFLYAAMHG